MSAHHWRSATSPKLQGVVHFDDGAFAGGPMPNPTRSLLLGDPTNGGLCWGCELYIVDAEVLVGGLRGTARLEFWQNDVQPPEGNVPIWYGRVIGQALGLRRVPAQGESTSGQ